MYFVKTPNIIRSFYKDYIWDVDTIEKEIYLTFDDGPTPEITEFVLNTLKQYNAKATFFCIGKNIENHPEIFQQIIVDGHTVGNHSQNHKNGWKTNSVDYIKSIDNCELSITDCKFQMINSKFQTKNQKPQTTNEIATLPLAMTSEKQKPKTQNPTIPKTKDQRLKTIRPPYGKIKRSQAKKLIAKGYKIIMWTVLSGDFDLKITKEKCLNNVIKNTDRGSIVVLHDSVKAYPHLKYTLPKVLEYFIEKGYVFKAL